MFKCVSVLNGSSENIVWWIEFFGHPYYDWVCHQMEQHLAEIIICAQFIFCVLKWKWSRHVFKTKWDRLSRLRCFEIICLSLYSKVYRIWSQRKWLLSYKICRGNGPHSDQSFLFIHKLSIVQAMTAQDVKRSTSDSDAVRRPSAGHRRHMSDKCLSACRAFLYLLRKDSIHAYNIALQYNIYLNFYHLSSI